MQFKVIAFGEGASIPYVNIGMSVIVFNLYVNPSQYWAYTGASNDPALGNFSFTTPWVNLELPQEKHDKWYNLHNKVLYVKLKPSHFALDSGIVDIELTQKDYSTGVEQAETITFRAENCTGWSLVAGDVSFKCELHLMEEPTPANG